MDARGKLQEFINSILSRVIMNVTVNSKIQLLIASTDHPRPNSGGAPIIWYHTRVQKGMWKLGYSTITM